MARRKITQDDVFAAARDLVGAGEQPSTLAIHKVLGKGSYSTIQKYLKEWEDSEEALDARTENLPAIVDLPEQLEQDALLFVKKLWKAAQDIAEDAIQQERVALAQAQAQAEKAKQEAIDYADDLSGKVEDLEEQWASAQTEAREALQARDLLQQQLANVTKENERLVQGLSDMQAEIKRVSEKVAQAETRTSVLTYERDKAVSDLALQKQEHQAALVHLASRHETELSRLEKRHDQVLKDLKAEQKDMLATVKETHTKALEAMERQHEKTLADYRRMG